ncbi:hypothetical protein K4K56_004417 [Colletotrichum sp. SAR 10_98]|nr:hypothetical protein K4K56_004417 [Colletotrichum sp. SAR 10_98]
MQGRQPWRRVTKKIVEDGRKQLEEALAWSRSEEGQRCRKRHRELARAEIAKHRPPSPGPDDDFDLDREEPPTASDALEVDIWASTTFLPKKTLYTGGFGFKVRILDRDLDAIRKELARGEDFEVEEVDDEEETVVSGLEPIIEEAGEGLMKDTDVSAVAKHGREESSDDDNSPKRQKR